MSATARAAVEAALHRFPVVSGHLDAATSGIPPVASVNATRTALAMWAGGQIDGPGYDHVVDRSRAAFARLIGVRTEDVACGPQVSPFAGLVAASLPRGAQVLLAEGDFASIVFPMLAQESRGVRIREAPLEQLVEAIDGSTTLVVVSAAQSGDGRVVDLDALAAAADHHGADVFLDATQAAGWMPIDGSRVTYVVAGAYKWLLSPRGTAFFAVRPEAAERLTPHTAGWYATDLPWDNCYGSPLRLSPTAKRFDVSPAWMCWAGTTPSLELIEELGVEAIGAYDLELAGRLREGLGMEPYPSPIVIADHPEAEERLARAGIRAAVRAGRVRLSCHLPSTEADVDRAIEALT